MVDTPIQARPAYPVPERQDIVEVMHGVPVADPYRYLEDVTDARTVGWSRAQDALVDAARAGWTDREALHARLIEAHRVGAVSVPVWRGERSFDVRRRADQEFSVLYVTEPDGTRRPLVDPIDYDPAGTTTLDYWYPSPDGALLAYGMSEGGTEDSVLRVLDVTTGDLVEGRSPRWRFSTRPAR